MNQDKHAIIKERVRKLNPIDDLMFKKMAEEKPFCEELLQTIMDDPQLKVLTNKAQWHGSNLQGRSVIMDAVCRLGDGRMINIEVQKRNDDNHQKRVRYHGAILTTNMSETGSNFEQVPDVCVVYIAKFSIFTDENPKHPAAVYHVDRIVRETGEIVQNGFQEIYVNAKARDHSKVSALMAVFTEDQVYDEVQFPVISESKHRYKETKKGRESMCAFVEEIYKDELDEMREKLRKQEIEYAEERQQYVEERRQFEKRETQHIAELAALRAENARLKAER